MSDLDPSDLISDEEADRWRAEDEAEARAERFPIGAPVRWPNHPKLGVCTVKHSLGRLAFVCPEGYPGCAEPIAVPHAELIAAQPVQGGPDASSDA